MYKTTLSRHSLYLLNLEGTNTGQVAAVTKGDRPQALLSGP